MMILRRARFHAAHRNQHLVGTKCESLHGHTYRVEVEFEFVEGGAVTVPFEDLARDVEGVTDILDHSVLVDAEDRALVRSLQGTGWHVVPLPFPTSAENLAAWLLKAIHARNEAAIRVRLAETDSSIVTVELEDLATWPNTE
jgi:6-pyruvoyl-tetrahydropterin synthase